MKIYLVRHGETDWNKAGRMQGRQEVDLNLFGLKQAHLLGKRLKNIPFDLAYSSPQSRAIQTAEMVMHHHPIHLKTHTALQEIDLGEWEGLTWTEVKRRYKGVVDDLQKDRKMAKIHGGETYEDVVKRAMLFLETLENKPYEHVLVMSHAGVIKMLIAHLLGLPLEKRTNFHLSNTGISVIEKEAPTSKWRILTINDISHLDEMTYE